MLRTEQVVFTWTGNDHAAGYEVAARSPGVSEQDARELAAWGPTRDAMLDESLDAESYNFHPLPSGAYCISRTVPVGGRRQGGQCLLTHGLIVPADVLSWFGNNPFSLIRAVSDAGAWLIERPHDRNLQPLSFPCNDAPSVDRALLAYLAVDPGPHKVAAMVQAARDAVCLAVRCTPSATPLIAGLFNCLPPECRTEFSFSTGLKFSPRRPFHIVALSGDPAERSWIAGYPNVTVLDLQGDEPLPCPLDGWSRFVEQSLSTGRIPFLAEQISQRRPTLVLDDLPALGLQLQEDLEAVESDGLEAFCSWGEESPSNAPSPATRADAAHSRFAKCVETASATASTIARPSTQLDSSSSQILEQLEHLDDLVFEAMDGRAGAMEELQAEWPKLSERLGEQLLAESREEYLRYALSLWEEDLKGGGLRHPTRAVAAIDVLCLLFGDAAQTT